MKKLTIFLGLCVTVACVLMLGHFMITDANTLAETYQLNPDNSVYLEFYDDTTAVVKGNGVIDAGYWKTCREKIAGSVTVLSFEAGVVAPEWCNGMFESFTKLVSLDLSNLDTSKVTDMGKMFHTCTSLTDLNLSNLDTSKVTNMQYMFNACNSLTSVDVSHLDTQNVTSMSHMFARCRSLTDVDFSNFDTSNVTGMAYMFYGCTSLTSVDLTGFDTENVTAMTGMFEGCTALTTLDISGLNTGKVADMASMFSNCTSLTDLNVTNIDTSSVTSMASMFKDCTSLTTIDFSNWVTSSLVNMSSMFLGCNGLTELDLSMFDTSKVFIMSDVFSRCTSLTTLNISNFNADSVVMYDGIFTEVSELETILLPQNEITAPIPLPGDYYNSTDPADTRQYNSLLGLKDGKVLKKLKVFEVEQTNVTTQFNGNYHSLGIKVLNSNSYTLKYKNPQTGAYTDDVCSYMNIGNYTVEYRIQAYGYKDYVGTGTINITEKIKLPNTLILDSHSTTASYPKTEEISFNIIQNESNGPITVTSSDNTKAKVSLDGTKVTVQISDIGDYTIKVTSGETEDYKETSVVFDLKVNISEYTYNVIYKSSTGVKIGSTEVTKDYRTVNEIVAPNFEGYNSPANQMVEWDSTKAKDIVFIYEPITYRITLDPNDGSDAYSKEYTIETETFSLEKPRRVGHTFIGWIDVTDIYVPDTNVPDTNVPDANVPDANVPNTNAPDSNTPDANTPNQDANGANALSVGTSGTSPIETVEIVKGSTGDLRYVANWQVNEYTYNIIYKSTTGVIIDEATITKYYGTTHEITPIEYEGYTTPGSQTVDWDSTEAKDIVFVYEPIVYKITVHLNNNTGVLYQEYTIESETFALNTPEKEGYMFVGWTKDGETLPARTVEIKKGTIGDFTYNANWVEKLPEIKDTGNGVDLVTILLVIEMFLMLIPILQKFEKH